MTSPDNDNQVCEGYPDWQSSPYVLPYAVGEEFLVIQGNCAPPGNGHRGVNRYSYDFDMPIGTPFVAAREGTVVQVEQSHFDGQIAPTGFDNYIVVRHKRRNGGALRSHYPQRRSGDRWRHRTTWRGARVQREHGEHR